jgi:hypothetical protein
VGSASVATTQGATIVVIPMSAIPVGVVPHGAADVAPLVGGISLMQWIGLKLDSFDVVVLQLR